MLGVVGSLSWSESEMQMVVSDVDEEDEGWSDNEEGGLRANREERERNRG